MPRSTDQNTDSPGWGPLARYVIAATLARTSDGGAVVAIVLMVNTSGGSGWLAGALGACITAPHLLGPFVARRLDTARDGRTVIAAASLAHGTALAAAVLLYPHTHPAVAAALLIVSGLFGPLLTGGISSRLPAIAGHGRRRQRRAQGWDVATYGIGGTVGPTLVAALSAWASPAIAALVLAAGCFVAAAVIRLLPRTPPHGATADVPRPVRTLISIVASGPLRRTLYLTVTVAFSVAALPVTAVSSTHTLGVGNAVAGILTAAYGLGNLAGSAGIMIRPSRAEADRLTTRLATAVAATLLLITFTPSFTLAVAAYAAAGIANAYFFAATLAARNEYAPDNARGQIFVWVGALKITAGSAGTAAAGALIGTSVALPLLLATALAFTSALLSSAERHHPRRRRDHHPGAALPAPAASPIQPESGHSTKTPQPKPPTS
ncbi:MFS transporter [Streptomyces sp. 11-1-2]|uniref:MFS transporter n=1 Tax=unclassified Streptomyces TaxID=2593676 RepID=UPI0013C52D70|nr:MFS transporter [Streptomyces sp. 11-1-2]